VIRAALVAYLARPDVAATPSAYSLGHDLFGRFGADPDLAKDRKRLLEELWSAKHDARRR
jgi:hypothetical protein